MYHTNGLVQDCRIQSINTEDALVLHLAIDIDLFGFKEWFNINIGAQFFIVEVRPS